jgi:hypothetical protein
MYAHTSHNRIVTASPPVGGSGFGRLGHGFAIPTPPSPTLPAPANLRFALYGAGNVSYNRNVKRNATLKFVEDYRKTLDKIFIVNILKNII